MEFLEKINRVYRKKVYDRFKHLRGITRVRLAIKWLLSRKLEKVDEEQAESIFDRENWDNLIILDACRYDLYQEVSDRKCVESRISLGSTTQDYLERTYNEGDFSDIVYISGNPFLHKDFLEDLISEKNPFHTKYQTFQTDWDEREGTVLPESIIRDAKTAEKLSSDKKKIIHFIQPHFPFVGSDIDTGFENSDVWLGNGKDLNIWARAERGEITQEKVWEAYRQNLEYVLPKARELAEELEGKTIITSDHGNIVGERGMYGHPSNSDLKVLRKVPWEVVE